MGRVGQRIFGGSVDKCDSLFYVVFLVGGFDEKSPKDQRFVINVSAVEGRFSKYKKRRMFFVLISIWRKWH